MVSSFSNYYLKCLSPDNIINFGKKIYQDLLQSEIKGVALKAQINLAVANLYYCLDPGKIKPFLSRYNINFIPAYRVDTLDNVSLIIIDPKKRGKRILEDLELERSFRTTLILKELTDEYILLDYKKIFSQKSSSHINEIDISEEVFRLIQSKKCPNKNIIHYNSVSSVYENVLKPIYNNIPLKKYSTEQILSCLKDETVVISNPSNENLDLFSDTRIKGIIQTPWLSQRIVEVAQSLKMEVYPGTGEII